MIEKRRYNIPEGSDDINISKWWFIHSMPDMDWRTKAKYLCFKKGEDPSNIDESYQNKKKILFNEKKVEKLIEKVNKELKVLFPDDFTTDFHKINTIKEILRLQLMLVEYGTWGKSNLIEDLKTQMDLLNSMLEEDGAGGPLENWKAFEQLCYLLSKADGVHTTEQLKNMTVYQFYMHKFQTQKYIDSQKPVNEVQDA